MVAHCDKYLACYRENRLKPRDNGSASARAGSVCQEGKPTSCATTQGPRSCPLRLAFVTRTTASRTGTSIGTGIIISQISTADRQINRGHLRMANHPEGAGKVMPDSVHSHDRTRLPRGQPGTAFHPPSKYSPAPKSIPASARTQPSAFRERQELPLHRNRIFTKTSLH